MCKGSGCAGSLWFELCTAEVICYCGRRDTGDSAKKSLGQLVWRRVHWRCGMVQDGKGLQSWCGDGEGVQQAGLEAVYLSAHGQDQAFFSNLVFLPMEAL